MDQVSRAILQASGGITGGLAGATSVDEVFSTYLYTGNAGVYTANNDIALSTNGGMIWFKQRDSPNASHTIVDTVRPNTFLRPNGADSQFTAGGWIDYTSTGFKWNLNGGAWVNSDLNANGSSYASWTFRRASKFLDIVTWTGNGTSPRDISHSLGIKPGFVIIKATSAAEDWQVTARRSDDSDSYLLLNSTGIGGAFTKGYTDRFWATSNNIRLYDYIGDAGRVNAVGVQYVAYIFAHDTSSTGLIQCSSFTTSATGTASVTLGWEPQFVLIKAHSGSANAWFMLDTARGWVNGGNDAFLAANSTAAEGTGNNLGHPTATGFEVSQLNSSSEHVYLAIRRSNKVPTSATEVFALGSGTTGGVLTSPTWPHPRRSDMAMIAFRDGSSKNFQIADRLRGFQASLNSASNDSSSTPTLSTSSTAQESVVSNMIRQNYGLAGTEDYLGYHTATGTGTGVARYVFKRAPGFFDIVCYTGNGSASNIVNHNLGTVPLLTIVKPRNSGASYHAWYVRFVIGTTITAYNGWTSGLNMDTTASVDQSASIGNAGWSITATSFDAYGGGYGYPNDSGINYVTYLFGSLSGISKVGSYTGNGSVLAVDCGFTTGARFVLIKGNASGSANDWFVFDTARGIVASTEPGLTMNSSATYGTAEMTGTDPIDPVSTGFAVNQVASSNLNLNNVIYYYLAIA